MYRTTTYGRELRVVYVVDEKRGRRYTTVRSNYNLLSDLGPEGITLPTRSWTETLNATFPTVTVVRNTTLKYDTNLRLFYFVVIKGGS